MLLSPTSSAVNKQQHTIHYMIEFRHAGVSTDIDVIMLIGYVLFDNDRALLLL
jgi:hypothetical protein